MSVRAHRVPYQRMCPSSSSIQSFRIPWWLVKRYLDPPVALTVLSLVCVCYSLCLFTSLSATGRGNLDPIIPALQEDCNVSPCWTTCSTASWGTAHARGRISLSAYLSAYLATSLSFCLARSLPSKLSICLPTEAYRFNCGGYVIMSCNFINDSFCLLPRLLL